MGGGGGSFSGPAFGLVTGATRSLRESRSALFLTEAPADWGVDPSAGDDSLDSALVSNEIGDVDAGTLAALPRAALEQLTIHLMANIRVCSMHAFEGRYVAGQILCSKSSLRAHLPCCL